VTPEEFRRHGHQLIDWIADYRSRVSDRPVMAQTSPGEVKARLPAAPPETPESFDAIVRDLDQIVVPGLSHWSHPSFFGYFPCNGELSSVLGDFASTGLGVLGLAWQSSPALTEVEEVATDWFRQMLGLSPAWNGVIQDTASTSTLVALLCARERASDYSLARGGLQAMSAPSRGVHVGAQPQLGRKGRIARRLRSRPPSIDSVRRGFRDAGGRAGRCHFRGSSGRHGAMRRRRDHRNHDEYRRSIRLTTSPDSPEARLVAARGCGDGRLRDGASGVPLDVERRRTRRLDRRESAQVAWGRIRLFRVLRAQAEELVRVMSTNPSYLQTAADSTVKNYRDWGLPLGRRFRALKLWFLIREQGVSGLQARLRRDLENARWLAERVQSQAGWRVLNKVVLQTLCVRHEPRDLRPDLSADLRNAALDRHTLAWCDRINRSGAAYLTPALLDGRWMVRVSIGALATEREHVERLWATMQTAVSETT
jgi:aromatic-L-amino-acid decarboxylase